MYTGLNAPKFETTTHSLTDGKYLKGQRSLKQMSVEGLLGERMFLTLKDRLVIQDILNCRDTMEKDAVVWM